MKVKDLIKLVASDELLELVDFVCMEETPTKYILKVHEKANPPTPDCKSMGLSKKEKMQSFDLHGLACYIDIKRQLWVETKNPKNKITNTALEEALKNIKENYFNFIANSDY